MLCFPVAAMDVTSEKFLEDKRKFSEFLDSDHRHGMYASKIGKMLSSEEKTFRLAVDLAHLREFDNALFRSLMNEPGEVLPPFEKALDETIRSRDPKWLPEGEMVRISLTGEFGAHTVSPRSLLATMMSKLVNVQGIVTKASLVRPKMVQSVHYCEATKETIKRIYRDVTTHDGPPTGSAYPTRDEEGNLLTTEFGLCKYRDSQVPPLAALSLLSCPRRGRPTDVGAEQWVIHPNEPGREAGDRNLQVGDFMSLCCSSGFRDLEFVQRLLIPCSTHGNRRSAGLNPDSRPSSPVVAALTADPDGADDHTAGASRDRPPWAASQVGGAYH